MLAGRGSAGDGSTAACTAGKNDIGFDRGISTGVQNFAGNNQFDIRHGMSPCLAPVGFALQFAIEVSPADGNGERTAAIRARYLFATVDAAAKDL